MREICHCQLGVYTLVGVPSMGKIILVKIKKKKKPAKICVFIKNIHNIVYKEHLRGINNDTIVTRTIH